VNEPWDYASSVVRHDHDDDVPAVGGGNHKTGGAGDGAKKAHGGRGCWLQLPALDDAETNEGGCFPVAAVAVEPSDIHGRNHDEHEHCCDDSNDDSHSSDEHDDDDSAAADGDASTPTSAIVIPVVAYFRHSPTNTMMLIPTSARNVAHVEKKKKKAADTLVHDYEHDFGGKGPTDDDVAAAAGMNHGANHGGTEDDRDNSPTAAPMMDYSTPCWRRIVEHAETVSLQQLRRNEQKVDRSHYWSSEDTEKWIEASWRFQFDSH
jgi:hypothetical protein